MVGLFHFSKYYWLMAKDQLIYAENCQNLQVNIMQDYSWLGVPNVFIYSWCQSSPDVYFSFFAEWFQFKALWELEVGETLGSGSILSTQKLGPSLWPTSPVSSVPRLHFPSTFPPAWLCSSHTSLSAPYVGQVPVQSFYPWCSLCLVLLYIYLHGSFLRFI